MSFRLDPGPLKGIQDVLDQFVEQDGGPPLSDDIVTWVSQVRFLKGQQFTFDKREYLLPIYRDPSPNIYVVKGRQVEFTEFAVNWLLFHLLKHPFTTGFYTTDTLEKVSAFSNVRLKEWAIRDSPILRNIVVDDGNVHHVRFPNGSHLYMYSGFKEFKMSRSFTIDFAVIDEAQNQQLSAINVIEEAQSHSKFKRKMVLGTGSEEGDGWHTLWHTGDQKHWDVHRKVWLAKKPENYRSASSYHLPQWIVPWISAEEIEKKRREYLPRLFTTEVEGWFYRGAQKPLTRGDIERLMDRTLFFVPHDKVDHGLGPVVLGVDWGGGEKAFTIPSIWQVLDKEVPRLRLLYIARITERSTEKQADMIAELMDNYRVDQGVMDAGGGTRQVEKLADRYGTGMLKCTYMQRPEEPLEFHLDENRVAVDRTWGIDSVIDLITRNVDDYNRIILPKGEPEKVEWMIDHLTAIEAESVDLPSGKKYVRYTHPEEQPDDALHSWVYAWLAFKALDGVGDYSILPVNRKG